MGIGAVRKKRCLWEEVNPICAAAGDMVVKGDGREVSYIRNPRQMQAGTQSAWSTWLDTGGSSLLYLNAGGFEEMMINMRQNRRILRDMEAVKEGYM